MVWVGRNGFDQFGPAQSTRFEARPGREPQGEAAEWNDSDDGKLAGPGDEEGDARDAAESGDDGGRAEVARQRARDASPEKRAAATSCCGVSTR